jgi:EAL domain-containing protein (putative c-di-GMP-specific phosphodiesterase class I)
LRLPKYQDEPQLSPAVIIPVAEELGLIGEIGRWVLRQACHAATTWPEHLTVAVNLSPAQFTAGDVCETVAAALQESGLEPQRLEIEITEGLLLGDTEVVMAQLKKLKELGVSIVMDDFGTGYSSLSYLWRFHFDKIKIDRSFMAAFDAADGNAETIVKTIVALGRSLHMRVTVEGVETDRQAQFVRGISADQVQGYYFGRPMPETELAAGVLADFQRANAPEASPVEPDAELKRAG